MKLTVLSCVMKTVWPHGARSQTKVTKYGSCQILQVVKWLRNGRGRCGSVGCGSCLGKTGPWSMEVPSEAGSTGSTA